MQFITFIKEKDETPRLYYIDLDKVLYISTSKDYITFYFPDRTEAFKVSEKVLLDITQRLATHVIYSAEDNHVRNNQEAIGTN